MPEKINLMICFSESGVLVSKGCFFTDSIQRRVKKNVKDCDLFISDDDHVFTRIGRHPASRAGAPL
jgi:hypothetical protein